MTRTLKRRSPGATLGKGNAEKLRRLGPDGRAAALLAARTAPARPSGARKGVAGEGGSTDPSGSSGLQQVLRQVTGSSSGSTGMGLLLPLVIVLALVGAGAYALTRHRGLQRS